MRPTPSLRLPKCTLRYRSVARMPRALPSTVSFAWLRSPFRRPPGRTTSRSPSTAASVQKLAAAAVAGSSAVITTAAPRSPTRRPRSPATTAAAGFGTPVAGVGVRIDERSRVAVVGDREQRGRHGRDPCRRITAAPSEGHFPERRRGRRASAATRLVTAYRSVGRRFRSSASPSGSRRAPYPAFVVDEHVCPR